MTQPYPLTEVFTNICPRTLGGIKRLGKVRYSYPSRMNGMAGMIQQPYPPLMYVFTNYLYTLRAISLEHFLNEALKRYRY